MKKWKTLAVNILIPLAVGGLAALLTGKSMDIYGALVQPPLSPPGWVFPIVWTALYTLMGISSYLIYTADSFYRKSALKAYAAQLIANFLWTIIFFNMKAYLFSFLWLLILLVLVALMTAAFFRINKTAAWLQIPYLLWVMFAGYLNFGIYILNR